MFDYPPPWCSHINCGRTAIMQKEVRTPPLCFECSTYHDVESCPRCYVPGTPERRMDSHVNTGRRVYKKPPPS